MWPLMESTELSILWWAPTSIKGYWGSRKICLPLGYSFKKGQKVTLEETRDKSSRKAQDLFMEDNALEAPGWLPLRPYGWSGRTLQHLPYQNRMFAKAFPRSILRVIEGKRRSPNIEKSADDHSTLGKIAPLRYYGRWARQYQSQAAKSLLIEGIGQAHSNAPLVVQQMLPVEKPQRLCFLGSRYRH